MIYLLKGGTSSGKDNAMKRRLLLKN